MNKRKEKKHKAAAGLFLVGMMWLLVSGRAAAAELPTEQDCYINEVYQGIFTETDIRAAFQSGGAADRSVDESPFFNNYQDVLDYVKEKMIARSTEFSFTVPIEMEVIERDGEKGWIHNLAVKDSMDERYSTSNKDGDYLDANYVGTDWIDAEFYDNENQTATFVIRNVYTSTAEQEAMVDAMLPEVMASLSLEGKSDYEKIKTIHDYIALHVTYKQNNDYECHSTYAALVKGEAVCQGYASLFFRMCKEVGIGSRYITGVALEPHGWNIVELEGKWYNVDCTFDDSDNQNGLQFEHSYFLKAPKDFTFHKRYSNYETEEFAAAHPMAEISYEDRTIKEMNVSNLSYMLQTMDGDTASTTADGKPKALCFYDSQNGRSVKLLKDITGSSLLSSGAYDIYGMDKTAGSEAVIREYCNTASMGYDGFFPYIVIIDGENQIRQVVSGYYTVDELEAALEKVKPQSVQPQPGITLPAFTDVPAGAWYTDAVNWAVQNGITSGTSSTAFSPDKNCTRGQIVTFLWRASGSPEPADTNHPFMDVDSRAYYYKPVLWAVEQGITAGTSPVTFSPEDTCTRAQAVTFLHRYAGSPLAGDGNNPFRDIKNGAYYYNPVLWAAANGITSGTSATAFSPDNNCTRSQIVTFLYRQKHP